MKRFFSFSLIALLSVVALTGCTQSSSDSVAGVFQPIIGTWNDTTVGVSSTLVFSSDGSTIKTTTVLGISATESGTWTSTDATITRTWSNGDVEVDYYTFSDGNANMTLSASPTGIATVYTRL